MSTQVLAIMLVLVLALGALGLTWFAVAACQLSSSISRSEERAAAGELEPEDDDA